MILLASRSPQRRALLGALGVASIRLAKLLQAQKELGGDGDQVLAALSEALNDVLQDWELSGERRSGGAGDAA